MFTNEAVDDSGTLMWTGKNGTKAVLLFPSQEAADAFMGTQCNLISLRLVELTPDNVVAWGQRAAIWSESGNS